MHSLRPRFEHRLHVLPSTCRTRRGVHGEMLSTPLPARSFSGTLGLPSNALHPDDTTNLNYSQDDPKCPPTRQKSLNSSRRISDLPVTAIPLARKRRPHERQVRAENYLRWRTIVDGRKGRAPFAFLRSGKRGTPLPPYFLCNCETVNSG
jgi:hypothetical protein